MGSTRICVQLCVYVTFVAAIVITTNRDTSKDIFECPGPLMYYKDLRCTPIYDDKDNCPKKFNCNHIKLRSRKKCYINGRVYKPNQFLYDKDSNVCDTSCICTLSPNRNQIAAFDCINFQCPKKKIKDGCYLRQDPTICCQNPIEICPKTQQDRPFCIVNNHRYLDGEYFKVNEEPDLICICQPGYKRNENVPPYCMKPNHSPCHPAFSHEDYFNRNCAPVYNYYEMDKCHVKMLCQVSGDTTIPRQLPFIMDDDWSNMCIFGNLLMRIGDRLEPSSIYTIDCICEIPPVLTCIHIS